MSTIRINGLRLTAHHGVGEQERRVGNEFQVDITLHVPAAAHAAVTDNIADTVNYADIVDIVKHEMAIPSRLIEAVAARIRDSIIARYGAAAPTPMVSGGIVTVAKLAPPVPAQLTSVSYTLSF